MRWNVEFWGHYQGQDVNDHTLWAIPAIKWKHVAASLDRNEEDDDDANSHAANYVHLLRMYVIVVINVRLNNGKGNKIDCPRFASTPRVIIMFFADGCFVSPNCICLRSYYVFNNWLCERSNDGKIASTSQPLFILEAAHTYFVRGRIKHKPDFSNIYWYVNNILGCQISSFRFFALYSMLYKKCYGDRI